MLFIDNTSTDVYFNLAVEEYLLKNYREDIFMLWQDRPAVVLGKYQNAQAEIDLDFVKEKRIDVARRYSGGGSVFHDLGNINVTFIENTNRVNFNKYVEQVLDFLHTVGILARADERRGIYSDRFKLSGSAQCIYKNRVMYHCTLLYATDLDMLSTSLNGKPEQVESGYARSVRSVRSEVTNLRDLLSEPLAIDDFKRLMFSFFFNRTEGNRIYNLSKDDLASIEQLKNEKYVLPEWILHRGVKAIIDEAY